MAAVAALATKPQAVAKDHLTAFVERIERLEEEKKALADDIRDVFAEAKGNGFDVKAMRVVIRLRKQDKDDLKGEVVVQIDGGPEYRSYLSSDMREQPVAMEFILDGSGSMNDSNKWTAATAALTSIFNDMATKNDPGLYAGLIIFSDANDKTGAGGGYFSDVARLTERFTRTGPEDLSYDLTVHDPKTWTKTWTIHMPYHLDSSYVVYEYACHEGNYMMLDALSGARDLEKQGKASKVNPSGGPPPRAQQ